MNRRSTLALVFLMIVPLPSSADLRWCNWNLPHKSSDPDTFVEFWLPRIERLYDSIPALSPREEQWLSSELTKPTGVDRALRSPEYLLREVRRDAGNLLGTLRVLARVIEPSEPRPPLEDWAFLTYALIDPDASLLLARLETQGLLHREAIPKEWRYAFDDAWPLERKIEINRADLARHILLCILPKVASKSP